MKHYPGARNVLASSPLSGPRSEVVMTRLLPGLLRVVVPVLCIALFGLTSPLHAQRADRAIISGIVTDEQGAAVPGATVTITNEQTGVETVLVTNAAGAYTSP